MIILQDGKPDPVKVTNVSIATEEIVQRSIELGGNETHSGRYYVQFFGDLAGYYKKEQIDQKMKDLRLFYSSVEAIASVVLPFPDEEGREKAMEGLRTLLGHTHIEEMLKSIEDTAQKVIVTG